MVGRSKKRSERECLLNDNFVVAQYPVRCRQASARKRKSTSCGADAPPGFHREIYSGESDDEDDQYESDENPS